MPRAAAIIIQDNSVALIERRRAGRQYFLFPGGKVEEGETLEEAVIREVREELGLAVTVGPLIAEVTFENTDADRRQQFYFLTSVCGGEFGTGHGAEMLGQEPVEDGTYAPVWLPLSALSSRDVRPRAVAELTAQGLTHGWPQEPMALDDPGV